MYALDGATGASLWVFHVWTDIVGSPSLGADGVLYFADGGANVYGLNALTGTQYFDHWTAWSYTYTSPGLGADGTVYVGSWDTRLYALRGTATLPAAPSELPPAGRHAGVHGGARALGRSQSRPYCIFQRGCSKGRGRGGGQDGWPAGGPLRVVPLVRGTVSGTYPVAHAHTPCSVPACPTLGTFALSRNKGFSTVCCRVVGVRACRAFPWRHHALVGLPDHLWLHRLVPWCLRMREQGSVGLRRHLGTLPALAAVLRVPLGLL
jgi:hypothetical protein